MWAEAGQLPRRFRLLLPPLVASAFLTETKLVPFLRNNVTLFEVLGAALIFAALFVPAVRRPLRFHPVIRVIAVLFVLAALSLVNIQPSRFFYGGVQVAILGFLLCFLVAAENLFATYRVTPAYLLRLVTYAVLLVGPWVVWEGLQAEGDIQAVGPFRNRAHMGSYMLTALWMALAYMQWPGLRRRDRLAAYGALALALYAIAVSGRRSVYLSLFLGLAALVAGFLVVQRRRRGRALVSILFAGGVLFFVYSYLARLVPQAAFFHERVHMIDDRLAQAVGVSEEEATERSFFALQQEAVRIAFTSHPLLGVGWGGFAKSQWSPTGHEVHSTPLRFVAETGLLGIVLYALLMGLVAAAAWRAFARLQHSPYGATAFTLCVGFASLCVSYLYNRHITERTFWLLLVALIAQEDFAFSWVRQSRRVLARARHVRQKPLAQPAAPHALPSSR
ncbi:MAG: O-antigen ligase family protein [Thermoanaerobaculia bacterium]